MSMTGEANAATRNGAEPVDDTAEPHANGDEIRRRLLTLAVQDYDDGDLDFRNGVEEQLNVLRDWWCDPALAERRFTTEHASSVMDRRDVEDFLHASGLREASESDAVILYVAGHGLSGRAGSHFLELPRTDPARPLATGYRTSDLIAAALDSHARHVLVIVNTCYSSGVDIELAELARDLHPDRLRGGTLAVLATTDVHETVGVRELSVLLQRVYTQLRTTAGITSAHLSIEEFLEELHRATAPHSRSPLRAPKQLLPVTGAGQPHLCLPNPGYRPPDSLVARQRRQVAVSRQEMDYWISRASGRTGRSDSGWYFSGRQPLTRAVASFLNDGPPRGHSPSLIVTGTAGSGKSAVIARAVTLSDPSFRADPNYAAAFDTAPLETVPRPGSVDVAVLGRQRGPEEILALLLEGIGHAPLPATPGEDRTAVLRTALLTAIDEREQPATLVIDGLDEAEAPYVLVNQVIAPLAQSSAAANVRLLIGVRSPLHTPGTSTDTPGAHYDNETDAGLLNYLQRALTSRTGPPLQLRTDGPETLADITAYLEALLSGAADESLVPLKVAQFITDRIPAISFLDARIAGQQVRDSDFPQHLLDDPLWQKSLGQGLIGLLGQDLRGLRSPNLPPHVALALLRAAAFAQGAGIPWGGIWPAIAEAVLDQPIANADRAIHSLLTGRLAGYLAQDSEDGRTVYRPVHERLAEVLRDQPHRLRTSHGGQQ
ncbi:AAA family ATPase [Streptomyces sp. NPDC088733]|uniref:AAA family ATPase n=1 Tax=Streptomyces sp. NPDC088733 TaxID=3365880 RepID=UPI0038015787